ncbi:MAG: hypothetical protein LC777_16270, partial [Actinobacteria bacterium]|nr:hypothetical protein [Actinomycetota bacterium]
MSRIVCRTTTRGSLWLYAFLAAAALPACLSLRAPAAEAAFPGQNGKIAFYKNQLVGNVYQIWSSNIDGSDETNLATVKTAGDPLYGGSPAFSADGKKIAFET